MKNVEEIYVLSPLQEALLLEDLSYRDLGEYCGQLSCELRGLLNLSALERSWQYVVDHQSVLRTFFVWKRLDKPLQVVQKQLKVCLEKHDWRELSPADQQEQLQTLLKTERVQSFNPSKAPLMRLILCQTSEDAHQLVCTYCRLILDDCSFLLIFKQVFACYERFCRGQDWQPEQNYLYRDYIAWLRQQDISKAQAYWHQALLGFTAPTPLVVERIPHSESDQEKDYTNLLLKMSVEVTAKLQALAGEHQLSLNTLLLGAWALLLNRYSGEQEVVFGTMVSGRPPELTGSKSIVGPFMNTQPVRVQVSPHVSVVSWLKELQTQQVHLSKYEYISPIQIREWSHLPKELRLFESQVVLDNNSVDSLSQKQFENIYLCNIQTIGQINFPVTIEAQWSAELTLQITYDCHRFDSGTITRMLENLQTLLEGMVSQPEQRLSLLPLLTQPALRQLLVDWNDTKTDDPQAQCIHQMFETQVERTPLAVAAVFEDKQLTYQELNRRANQLAHQLRTLGVEPDAPIGICMKRSLEMIVGVLAILKAGGACVPLDPAYPFERLSFMLKDAQLPVLVTQEELVEELPSHWAQVVCVDLDWKANADGTVTSNVQETEENLSNEVTGKNIAYIIYTSGTTGTPKGVLIEHQGLCNVVSAQIRSFDVHPDSRVLQFASFSFDASISEIFMALCSGASLYLGTPDSLRPGSELIQLLHNQAITHVTLPPSALAAMPLEELPALQTIIVAGEPCSLNLVEQWSKGRRFFNAYGPTEATICATVAECSDGDRQPSIGRPIANTQIYILDCHQQPVPIGVSGEIYIGGAGLARGYLNNPELTQEKFIANPFDNSKSSRLYKTGDLARYLSNGNIEFLGRVDHQVKVRGFRIEPGEIEAVLAQHRKVQQTVVIAREDQSGNKRLVAYVVPNQQPAPTTNDMRRFLQDSLPEYMVPSSFVMLDALPLSPNGKVDRHALPAPDPSHRNLETGYLPPRTPTEEALSAIWADVLGLEQVGIHDNFFELGGDSILSIQVVTRANQAGLQLVPKQLFQHQTIAELVSVVGKNQALIAQQGIVSGKVPLTPIQRWFFEQHFSDPHHFNQSVLLVVSPDLKPSLLQQVLQQLLVHHDALRLRFVLTDSVWQQRNSEDQTVALTFVDLSGIAKQEQPPALQRSAAQYQAGLNLSEGPLMQAVLFHLGIDQPDRLLLIIHHLAVDGVSWRILLEDLTSAYQQIEQGQQIQLPPKTTAFKDWAERLLSYGQSPALAAELDYWLGQSRSQVTDLPVDYPSERQANTVASSDVVTVSLSVEETRALLQEVPSAYNTQINDVLLTALVQSFAQWTGERALLVDLEGHGREELFADVDVSRTVGWFTSLFPIRLELGEVEEPGAVLKSVKEQLRRLPKQGIGYGLLRYLSLEEATRSQLSVPTAEVNFNYLGQFDRVVSKFPVLGFAHESSGAIHSPKGDRTHLLSVNGFVTEGRLQMDWTYSQNIHQRITVEHLAFEFIKALTTLITHCQSLDARGYTPSDFSSARLNQQQLDKFIAKIKQTGRR